MRVVIAGGHGKVALLLERRLAETGHEPVGLVRNRDQIADLAEVGAESVVLDLEQASVDEVAAVLAGADAVVFAAGAGPNSGPERKKTVDQDGARLLADAAEQAGVRRYVLLSSMGTEEIDPTSDDPMAIYLRAKAAADDNLRERDLDWTIIQPGRLTDDLGTEHVQIGTHLDYGEIPRADVAATIATVLHWQSSIGRTFNLVAGPEPIEDALSDV